MAENTAAVGTLTATDPDAADTAVDLRARRHGRRSTVQHLRQPGVDCLQQSAPDFENPQGGASDDSNEYSFTVTASAGGTGRAMSTPARTVTVTVTDVAVPAQPAAPTFGTTTANSLAVHWLAPASPGAAITDYDVRYREEGATGWTAHAHDGTARTATLAGLTPNQSYEVQVLAKNVEGGSPWSDAGTATTTPNTAPAFVQASYGFTLAENADGSTTAIALGRVSATDADGHPVEYSIAAGDDAGVFAIVASGTNAGALTYVGGGANHEATPTIALTVRASDDHNGSADVIVTVTVTDVDGEAPAAPAPPEVTASAGSTTSLDVRWTAPDNAGPAIADYDVEYRLASSTSDADWTDHAHLGAGTTATIAGLREDTAYQVRVLARSAEGASGWSQPGTGSTRNVNAPARPLRGRPSATRPRPPSW